MVFEFHRTIDSTNTEASRQLENIFSELESYCGLHKKIIWSQNQSAGRGRLGRSFFSPESGIYMSLIYCPEQKGSFFDPAVYTAAAAVAVSRAIKKIFQKDCSIKWVNDVYVAGKKVCGILTEGKINPKSGKIEALVIGIGVNIYTPKESFPPEIQERAGSILKEVKEVSEIPVRLFVEEIAGECCRIYDSFRNPENNCLKETMEEYRSCSNLIGKKITVTPVIEQKEGTYEALVTDITEDARLVVQLDDGNIRELSSGEVTLHS